MTKILARPISGVPEWLPDVRQIELAWLDTIRAQFERFGYRSVETSAIERLEVLSAKGEIDKEIYAVKKLHEDAEETYGLHYDLTVPLARYVAQNYGHLTFPFRRYQMQKIWRGERPQRGRYREFLQCDVDVVDTEALSPYFDFEVLAVGYRTLQSLPLPPFEIGVSNRKVYEGYLEALGVPDPIPALRLIDKRDKVGAEGVQRMLRDDLGLPMALVERTLLPAAIRSADLGFAERFRALGVASEKAEAGLRELEELMTLLHQTDAETARTGGIVVDLSFVRGFDYYTGVIFEGHFTEEPDFGSICAGGRYDDLAGSFSSQHLPGVGFSIGFSRIFGKMVEDGRLPVADQHPVDAVVLRTQADDLPTVCRVADTLRQRGFRVEVYSEPIRLSKQFKYAGRKNIPWVWIASREDPEAFEVKNMETGTQEPADPATWTPAP